MESTSKKFHFEDLIIRAIKERKAEINTSEVTDALVKFLVEIRESARKNENYEAYDHITQAFEEDLGILLREETRIVARKI